MVTSVAWTPSHTNGVPNSGVTGVCCVTVGPLYTLASPKEHFDLAYLY